MLVIIGQFLIPNQYRQLRKFVRDNSIIICVTYENKFTQKQREGNVVHINDLIFKDRQLYQPEGFADIVLKQTANSQRKTSVPVRRLLEAKPFTYSNGKAYQRARPQVRNQIVITIPESLSRKIAIKPTKRFSATDNTIKLFTPFSYVAFDEFYEAKNVDTLQPTIANIPGRPSIITLSSIAFSRIADVHPIIIAAYGHYYQLKTPRTNLKHIVRTTIIDFTSDRYQPYPYLNDYQKAVLIQRSSIDLYAPTKLIDDIGRGPTLKESVATAGANASDAIPKALIKITKELKRAFATLKECLCSNQIMQESDIRQAVYDVNDGTNRGPYQNVLDIPPYSHFTLYVQLNPQYAKATTDYQDDYIRRIDDGKTNKQGRRIKLKSLAPSKELTYQQGIQSEFALYAVFPYVLPQVLSNPILKAKFGNFSSKIASNIVKDFKANGTTPFSN